MRWLTGVLVAFALVCPAFAQTYQRTAGFCADGGQQPVTNGVIASGIVPIGAISPAFTNGTGVVGSFPGCTISVFNSGTNTLSTIYSDSSGTPKANPFTASSTDGYWFFYSTNGAYDVQLSGGGIVTPFLINTFTVITAGGSDTQVQVNCSGLFCGYSGLTWTNGSTTLAITGTLALTGAATISTGLSINGGTQLTTTNRTGTGNLVLATSPSITTPSITSPTFVTNMTLPATVLGASAFSGALTFNSTIAIPGGIVLHGTNETLTAPSDGTLTHTFPTGDTCIKQLAGLAGTISTSRWCSIISGANVGEVQFVIDDAGPFGWRWVTTSGGTMVPMYLNGSGNGLTLTNNADVSLFLNATNGTVTTNSAIKSVISNSNNGEVQFVIANSASFWRFVASANNGIVMQVSGKAPTNSVIVEDSGELVAPNGVCTANTVCWTSAAGAPGGACINGSLYTNTTGGAGTTTYECYSATWHSIG